MMGNQHRNDYRAARLLAGLLILACWAQSHAQSRDQSAPADRTDETDPSAIFCPLDVLTIEVRVTDPRGEEASSLGRDAFTVYENGVEQQIRLWTKLAGPVTGNDEAVYVMAYTPVNLHDGKFHKIRVVVRGKNKRKLKAKLLSPAGYEAEDFLRSLKATPPHNGVQRTRH